MALPIRRYWTLLVKYLRPQQGRVLLLAGLLLTKIGLALLNPQIMRFFIDTAQAGGAQMVLLRAALLFLCIAFAGQVLTVFTNYLSEQVGWTATNALRFDLVAHCLHLDLTFHTAHTPGELIERIDGDVEKLANFFTRFTVHILGNGLLLIGVLILLFREDWRVGLGLLSFALAALLLLVRLQRRAVPAWDQLRQLEAEFYGFLGEQLTSTEDVRANGAQDYVMQRFYTLLRGWLPVQMKAHLSGYSMSMVTTGLFAIGALISFGLGGVLWQSGVLTIGTVYLIVRYTDLIRLPLTHIRTELTDLQQAEASMARIERLLQTQSKLAEGAGDLLPGGPLAVDFEQVSFGYAGAETVLRNITFHLAPGRVLGLLGRTGSGKSTLARLLLRLYDASSGEICVGDVPVGRADLAALRRHVGMVTQAVQLFQASVRDNLTFFNPAISDAQIMAVLADLGLLGWLDALPAGLDTALAAGGGNLSAGQAQLLAFARIFLLDPGLVILDEASSRLDAATEQLIERAVSKLLQNRTAILIAHRLGTVQRADEILILEKGEVLEQGLRTQLAADPTSHFHHLLHVGLEEVLQ
ncbi:MAG: ABC transporter ATP-binding protein [Caldilineaceae bacterium]